MKTGNICGGGLLTQDAWPKTSRRKQCIEFISLLSKKNEKNAILILMCCYERN